MRKPPALPPSPAEGSGAPQSSSRTRPRPPIKLPKLSAQRLHAHAENATLALPADCLVIFVQVLKRPLAAAAEQLLSVAGCAVPSAQLLPVLRWPWQDVRRAFTGSTTTRLRSVRRLTDEHYRVLHKFARQQCFIRVGTLSAVPSAHSDDPRVLRALLSAVAARALNLAHWLPFTSALVIVPSHQELSGAIDVALSHLQLPVHGINSEVLSCQLKPKSHEPGLEVANFLAHAFLGQAAHRLAGGSGYAPLFQAFYQDVEPQWASVVSEDVVPGVLAAAASAHSAPAAESHAAN